MLLINQMEYVFCDIVNGSTDFEYQLVVFDDGLKYTKNTAIMMSYERNQCKIN